MTTTTYSFDLASVYAEETAKAITELVAPDWKLVVKFSRKGHYCDILTNRLQKKATLEMCDATMEWNWKGFHEYARIIPLLQGKVFEGMASVHQTVLHEIAHLLTHSEWTTAKPHGAEFQQNYLHLMEDFPFSF